MRCFGYNKLLVFINCFWYLFLKLRCVDSGNDSKLDVSRDFFFTMNALHVEILVQRLFFVCFVSVLNLCERRDGSRDGSSDACLTYTKRRQSCLCLLHMFLRRQKCFFRPLNVWTSI